MFDQYQQGKMKLISVATAYSSFYILLESIPNAILECRLPSDVVTGAARQELLDRSLKWGLKSSVLGAGVAVPHVRANL